MGDFTEYKRPFIVLLVFSIIILIAVNYGPAIFKYENFVDAPYTCNPAATSRSSCLNVGGYWSEDGPQPAGCPAGCGCCIPNPTFPQTVTYPALSCPAATTTAFTLTEANAAYTTSMLPTSTVARNADNTMTDAALQTHIEALKTANKLQAAPPTTADSQTIHTYLAADETAMQELQTEYCYYTVRYTYVIQKLIELSATASASAAAGADWLTAARLLNQRLLDCISIMRHLTTQRLTYGSSANTIALNASLAVRMKALSEQGNDLASPNANTALYKKMVEYTKQKGKANGNLVLLYTFMNLIALGMLFYVYRAT